MKLARIALALAAALAVSTAHPVTPEVQARRAAVDAARAEYVSARDRAKVDYSTAAKACGQLAAEGRAGCIAQAKAQRKQSFAAARTHYNEAVARARNTKST